jgi:hypothetical protein
MARPISRTDRTACIAVVACLAWASCNVSAANADRHVIAVDRPILAVEDGLLLGNGDLSASVYQSADRIIWRFGKGDVWDRRHDTSDDPKPLDIDELAHGMAVEGWKADFYQPIKPLHGTDHPARVKEVSSDPPSYLHRPYPCPKPVGELSLQLPKGADPKTLKISWRLLIEEGRLEITCTLPDGRRVELDSFVAPRRNCLVVHWHAQACPVEFALRRWADPPYDQFGARVAAETHYSAFKELYRDPKVTPLAPPTTRPFEGLALIEQAFFPDPLFAGGFRYWLVPFAPQSRIEAVAGHEPKESRLRITPDAGSRDGWLAVAVPTSSDAGNVEGECRRTRAALAGDPSATMTRWRAETIAESRAFWSKSSVAIADPVMESLWYETFHLRRSIYRGDSVPPGLFLPSVMGDYSIWHGDYHTNFNLQAPFIGNYEANHLEIGDAFFRAMDFFLVTGRKTAHDYYHARGACISLTGFPIRTKDDPFGIGPFSRMAYMTGWTMQQYWLRYVYSGDKHWLRDEGYPAIRDGALFYTDFLKKRGDGLYHAFPSCQEEQRFTGNPADYTDQPQVLQHARYALRAAIGASRELGLDEALRAEWQDRLDHMAPDAAPYFGYRYDASLEGLAKLCDQCSPPQWGGGRPYRPQASGAAAAPASLAERFDAWWICHPTGPISALRDGSFAPDRDYKLMRKYVESGHRCNGFIYTTAPCGHDLVFNETLSVVGPLLEMMLQSWDGALRVFPAWPRGVDAQFKDLRAEGAFLVSAAWSQGHVSSLSLRSEKGKPCKLYSPWAKGFRVTDRSGKEIGVKPDVFGRPEFATQSNTEYRIEPL